MPRRRHWHETATHSVRRHRVRDFAGDHLAGLGRPAGDRRLKPEAEHFDGCEYFKGGQQSDHPNPAVRPNAGERSPQPSLASVLGTAADYRRHRPGEQPDEAGAEPRYDVARIDQQFQQLFPSYSGNITQAKLLSDARARWQASVDTFKHTMEVQSRIVSDIQADEATLSTLVGQSQGAAGALQGIQSTNQLLALQSRQLGSTQALLSANARAQATEAMRRAEVEEAARAEWQRFWASGVSYTSAPVQVFGGAAP